MHHCDLPSQINPSLEIKNNSIAQTYSTHTKNNIDCGICKKSMIQMAMEFKWSTSNHIKMVLNIMVCENKEQNSISIFILFFYRILFVCMNEKKKLALFCSFFFLLLIMSVYAIWSFVRLFNLFMNLFECVSLCFHFKFLFADENSVG